MRPGYILLFTLVLSALFGSPPGWFNDIGHIVLLAAIVATVLTLEISDAIRLLGRKD
jgi:hypothetical protein